VLAVILTSMESPWNALATLRSLNVRVAFRRGFLTPSGKCDLDASALDYTPPVESRLGAESTAATRELVS
jgi:hypothetical protein